MFHQTKIPEATAAANASAARPVAPSPPRGADPQSAALNAFAAALCPFDLTPWYETPEARKLLASCKASEPAIMRRRNNLALVKEWLEWDDTDPRVEALNDIRCDVVTPILRDPIHYKRSYEAGQGVTVDMALDAVLGIQFGGRDDEYRASLPVIVLEGRAAA